MQFVKYKPDKSRNKTPMISVSSRSLQINKACWEKYFNGFGFAELYYDEQERVIGIKPTKEESKDAVPIKHYDWRSTSIINCAQFISFCKLGSVLVLDVKDDKGNRVGGKSVNVPCEWNMKDKMIYLRLK